MKHWVVFVVAFVAPAWRPASAQAWNSIGHMAVAKLAYDRLSDGQKTKLFAMLRSHPHFDKFLAAGRPDEISEVEWVIVRTSVWPDWVRPRSKGKKKDPRGAEVTRYHRSEDHYVNIPLIDPKDADSFAGKTLVDPDLTNILDALKQRSNEVRTKTMADVDKAVAVCWIFHLVGDIHQPLHNVAYFSREFRKGDMGGNLFGVRAAGQPVRLHSYWDNLLGDDPNYADDSAEHQARIYREALAMAARLRTRQLTDAEQGLLDKNTTIASWSQESYELAKTVGYAKADGTPLPGIWVPFNGKVPDKAPDAGADYVKTARATAEVRIVLAGHRLAERMKTLLAK
ncbi:MAG: S1/P1 nuclease [Gemmataceae bacterium]|nr:S1/P1 nuclease [Gemmataceae bacterium]